MTEEWPHSHHASAFDFFTIFIFTVGVLGEEVLRAGPFPFLVSDRVRGAHIQGVCQPRLVVGDHFVNAILEAA